MSPSAGSAAIFASPSHCSITGLTCATHSLTSAVSTQRQQVQRERERTEIYIYIGRMQPSLKSHKCIHIEIDDIPSDLLLLARTRNENEEDAATAEGTRRKSQSGEKERLDDETKPKIKINK